MNRILIDFSIRLVIDEFSYVAPTKCSLRNFFMEHNLGDVSLVKELRAVKNVLLIKTSNGWILNADTPIDKRDISTLCIEEYKKINSIHHSKERIKKLYENIDRYFEKGIITEEEMKLMKSNMNEKYKWL